MEEQKGELKVDNICKKLVNKRQVVCEPAVLSQ